MHAIVCVAAYKHFFFRWRWINYNSRTMSMYFDEFILRLANKLHKQLFVIFLSLHFLLTLCCFAIRIAALKNILGQERKKRKNSAFHCLSFCIVLLCSFDSIFTHRNLANERKKHIVVRQQWPRETTQKTLRNEINRIFTEQKRNIMSLSLYAWPGTIKKSRTWRKKNGKSCS